MKTRSYAGVLALFSITIFVSSALLFLVQPMLAKMILPLLGGTAAVWSTCMVFFQATLLAGYGYAHVLPSWLGVRRHAVLHLGLLGAILLLYLGLYLAGVVPLPIGVPAGWIPPLEANPIPWLLGLLTVAVGLPFFIVSTSGPLLQKWFASTGHPKADDPYFLYGASNLGSLLALLSYPFLLEPALGLSAQSWLWAGGYLLLLPLAAACAALLWLTPRAAASALEGATARQEAAPSRPGSGRFYEENNGQRRQPLGEELPERKPSPPLANGLVAPTWARRARWVILAFVPSSLMLSVTTFLSTDTAAIPLMWVIPLALYLLTFILVFARRPPLPHAALVRWMPLVMVVVVFTLLSEASEPVWLVLLIHWLGFFVVAMVCHGELARDRPPVHYLTEFYFWLSVGGVLGGLFNSLVATLVFWDVLEYPLGLTLACLLRPNLSEGEGQVRERPSVRPLDLALPLALGLLTAGLVLGGQAYGLKAGPPSFAVMFGVPAILCYTFLGRPLRFALGVVALLLAGSLYHGVNGKVLFQARSFFGVHRITRADTEYDSYYQLIHGNTIHGRRSLMPGREAEPVAYYYRGGPIGGVFQAYNQKYVKDAEVVALGSAATLVVLPPPVAVIGLGAGALASFAKPGEEFTYYEIDPVVERIARDTRYFEFLSRSPAHVNVVLGDARLTLARAPDEHYGLIVVDGFSSDSIPLHLLTREALRLYLSKLRDDGLLAFHISNRYLHLHPVLAALARDAGLYCRNCNDLQVLKNDPHGNFPSEWVIMARHPEDTGKLTLSALWMEMPVRPGRWVWTDDYSNLLSVFQWVGGSEYHLE